MAAGLPRDLTFFKTNPEGQNVERTVRLVDVLGDGGEGTVFLGEMDGQNYAVKYVKLRLQTGKTRESVVKSNILNAMSEYVRVNEMQMCPNILRSLMVIIPAKFYSASDKLKSLPFLNGHSINNESVYVISNYLRGSSLNAFVEQSKEREDYVYDVKRTFLQIVRAVKCMHDHGFVHRDLKPQNIMYENDDNITVIDFGSLCQIDKCAFKHDGFTPEYVPPEQANFESRSKNAPVPNNYAKNVESNRELYKKYDVFSLGCTLFNLLTTKILFGGVLGALAWDKNVSRLSLPQIPNDHPQFGWIHLILDMIHPDPKTRFFLDDALLARIDALPEPDFTLFTGIAAKQPAAAAAEQPAVAEQPAAAAANAEGGSRHRRRQTKARRRYRRRISYRRRR